MKLKLFLLCLCLATSTFCQIDFSIDERKDKPLLIKMDSVIKSGAYEHITSILVARNSKVIFEEYYNGTDVHSKHNTRSATKTMATLLTGIAIDKGFIKSEQDKIFKYLQHKLPVKNPDTRKDNITIEDLLTMSSILECDDSNQFSRGNEERMYIIEDWTQFYLDLPIRSFPFGPKPKDLPYGRSMSYCSAGAATLAEVVESAVNAKLQDFAKDYLFDPLEISDYKLDYTPQNIVNTAGGSEYKSRDFLKLIQMCLNKGRWNGKQVISEGWIQKASTPKVNAFPGMDYGYLLWLTEFGKEQKAKIYAMAGNGGNKILACPELDLAVVITSTNYGNRNAHDYTNEIMNEYIIPTAFAMD